MNKKNAIYAQSGGVTPVINNTARGLIEAANHSQIIDKVYAGHNGILGILHEKLIDTSHLSPETLTALGHTPSGAFGSCRYKLKSLEENQQEYARLLEVFQAHNVGYFFYNGGGDSMDTAHKVATMSQSMGAPVQCIGLPKTVDNDLPYTDCSPGFGSVGKYVATSTLEASLDVASMAATSTKVFILEVMGRHAGWIAAASALANSPAIKTPHLILLPEVPFHQQNFLQAVDKAVKEDGFAVIVASEGIQDPSGNFLSESGLKDAFGHAQLGGVAPLLASLVKAHLGYKYHWAVSDYLQRASRHIASKTDVAQSYALGKTAIRLAEAGKNAIMATIERQNDVPYEWTIGEVPLEKVANQEKKLPPTFIREDGFGVTDACIRYLQPLIEGEDFPPFKNGIPQYITLNHTFVKEKLAPWQP